jgi:tetratricopeptide (TPR) repeat protein
LISGYNHFITSVPREATLTNTLANLQPALDMALRTLQTLETQVAGFGSLEVPVHLVNQLEDARQKVAEMQKQIAAQQRRFGHFYLAHAEDASGFAAHLSQALESGFPAFPTFLDQRDLTSNSDYAAQIDEALKTCKGLILIVSAASECEREVSLALRYKKPVIPVCPTGVQSIQDWQFHYRPPTDFTSFQRGLDALRRRLANLDTPAGQFQTLQERLADAQRDLRKAPPADRARIQTQIAEMQAEVANWQTFLADPQAASERTERSIQSGLERERQPEKPAAGKAATKFINPPPVVAPTYFQDRLIETEQIVQFLCDDAQRLMTVVGRGGVGKTAMTCRLLKHLENGTLPDDLHQTYGKLPVDGIVYLSETGSHRINFPNLFADLCKLLPAAEAAPLEALYKDPQTATAAKMLALLEHFPAGRTLVLLDNFENAIDAETHAIRDAELDEALRALLSGPHHTVKAVLTTRIAPRALNLVEPSRQRGLHLDDGLDSPYAENVLRALDADGSVGLRDAPAGLLDQARRRTRGYPRALEALYASLRADYHTTLQDLLPAEDAPLPELVVEKLVGEAFHRLDPAAQQVMEALAIYNRPVAPAAVDYLLQPHQPGSNSAAVLNRLANMHFARREAGKYWLHPVDGEYALRQIGVEGEAEKRTTKGTKEEAKSDQGSGDWAEFLLDDDARYTAFTRHDLWQRAADYFKQARKPRQEWKKLEDLAAQLAEFDLRCAAGDFDTAADVLSAIDDLMQQWGHYQLTVQLNEALLGKVKTPQLQMFSFNELGWAYRTLGQVDRAIKIYQQGLSISQESHDRGWEGSFLGNLGNCYANLGQTARAIEFSEQALVIAREFGDRLGEGDSLGSLGNCYTDLGQTVHAIEFYEQALVIHREIGNRSGESLDLCNWAEVLIDEERYQEAIHHAQESAKIGDAIGFPTACTGAMVILPWHISTLAICPRLVNLPKLLKHTISPITINTSSLSSASSACARAISRRRGRPSSRPSGSLRRCWRKRRGCLRRWMRSFWRWQGWLRWMGAGATRPGQT